MDKVMSQTTFFSEYSEAHDRLAVLLGLKKKTKNKKKLLNTLFSLLTKTSLLTMVTNITNQT